MCSYHDMTYIQNLCINYYLKHYFCKAEKKNSHVSANPTNSNL